MAREHDASAKASADSCKRGIAPPGGVCWTSLTNPTAEDLKRAELHRKMAADHRAASQALRDAESRSCAGIAESDRDQSPFEHRDDIDGVEPLYSPLGQRSGGSRAVGAVVRIRARPGLTAEWLQRVVECHIARNASMGYAMLEMSHCPLMLKGVTATVASTGNGFAVSIRADDVETANEIRPRAEALIAR
jgi:hypothetical protein